MPREQGSAERVSWLLACTASLFGRLQPSSLLDAHHLLHSCTHLHRMMHATAWQLQQRLAATAAAASSGVAAGGAGPLLATSQAVADTLQAGCGSSLCGQAAASVVMASGFVAGSRPTLHQHPHHHQQQQQPLQQLARCVTAACCRAADEEQADGRGSFQEQHVHRLVLAAAAGYAACKLPAPCLPGAAAPGAARQHAAAALASCAMTCLFGHLLVLDGLWHAAATGAAPSEAQQWLAAHAQSPAYSEAQPLVNAVGHCIQLLPPEGVAVLMAQQLRRHTAAVHERYAVYVMGTPAQWVAAVDTRAVTAVLDRLFACTFAILATAHEHLQVLAAAHQGLPDEAWASSQLPSQQKQQLQPGQAAAPRQSPPAQLHAGPHAFASTHVAMLGCLADLHFCRLQTPGYSQLLGQLVSAVASDPSACWLALDLLPCYEAITKSAPANSSATSAPVPRPGFVAPLAPTQRPARWQVDGLLLSQLLFLLPVLALCAARCADVAAAGTRLLPHLLLLLPHHAAAAASQAHAAYASLVGALHRSGAVQLVEQSLPFYVERSLEAGGDRLTPGHLDGFATGLKAALQALLPGSPVVLHCLRAVSATCIAWLHQHHADTAAPVPAAAPQGIVTGGALGDFADPLEGMLRQTPVRLFHLLADVLVAGDFQLGAHVEQLVAGVVADASRLPSPLAPALLTVLYRALLASEDYSRKGRLMEWFHGSVLQTATSQQPQPRQPGQPAGGAAAFEVQLV